MFDIVIVGASFAGLSFADEISKTGLKVLVIDKQDVCVSTHPTTGILGPASIKAMHIDDKLILNKISNFNVEISDSKYKSRSKSPRYFVMDSDAYINEQYNSLKGKGILFDFDFTVKNISRDDGVIKIDSFKNTSVKCKFIVVADGAASISVSQLNLSNKNVNLIGVEHIFKCKKRIKDISIKLDYDLSPGYVSWMTPHGDAVAIGTASKREKFDNSLLRSVIEHYQKEIGKDNFELITKKSGLIPIGGVQKDIIGDDYVLIGDAGGFCGPVLANGIYTAFYSGKVAAIAVGKYFETKNKDSLLLYPKRVKYLKKHLFIRKLFNKLNSNKKFGYLNKVFLSDSGDKFLEQLLFKLPKDIKSMLSLILGLIKNPKNIIYLIKIVF